MINRELLSGKKYSVFAGVALTVLLIVAIVFILTRQPVQKTSETSRQVDSITVLADSDKDTLQVNDTAIVRYEISTTNPDHGISGFELGFETDGVIEITGISEPYSVNDAEFMPLIHNTNMTTADLAYVSISENDKLPKVVTLEVTVKGLTPGEGSLRISQEKRDFIGNVEANTFVISEIDDEVEFTVTN